MSQEVRCDGCGCKVGNDRHPNYWHVVLMGDTTRSGNGTLLDKTGIYAGGTPLSNADVCIPCMIKTQGETT